LPTLQKETRPSERHASPAVIDIPNNFQNLLACSALSLLTDACHPPPWVDALMNRRALCERSELDRHPVACVHLI